MGRKAVFLDRDGTINQDVGYLYREKDLAFIPRAIDAMKKLQRDHILFIITNQQGISQGVFSEKDFLRFNKRFLDILNNKGVEIKEVYYCPHTREENCRCRKPETFFIEEAKKEYCLDLKNSYMIGDHSSDIEVGQYLDIKTVYLLSGHGRKHAGELRASPGYIAEDLYQASLWITDQEGKDKDG